MKSNKQSPTISFIVDGAVGTASQHGLNKIILALQEKGISFEEVKTLEAACGDILIVIGLGERTTASVELLKPSDISMPKDAESLLILHTEWNGKPTLLVTGSDDRGLMYALLDVADRIGWPTEPENPLSEVKDSVEKPAVVERALSIYTMNRAHFESFFYNEDYWSRLVSVGLYSSTHKI